MIEKSSLEPLSGNIGNYTIFKTLTGMTVNELYIVHPITMPNGPLYILKKYNEKEGYLRELKVFQLEQIYTNIFVGNCDYMVYKGTIFQYTICNYSKLGSLCEFGQKLKQFPLESVKFYMHSLFSQLKVIHQSINIPFRTLYHSDIIFTEDYQLFIVGWSKLKCEITQAQLIYDCGQIMYYMITNSIPQQKSICSSKNYKRFLSESYWNISKKKHPYLKYLPKDQKQLKKWIDFLKYITTSPSNIKITDVLNHEFFNQIINEQSAYQIIQNKYLDKKSKSKQKHNKNFQLKLKRDQIMNKLKEDQQKTRSYTNMYQIVHCPIIIEVANKKEKQMIGNVPSFKQTINQLIYKFLDAKLCLAIKIVNNDTNESIQNIFVEDWIGLIDYKINQQNIGSENELKYLIKCEFNFTEKEEMLPNLQEINFEVIVYLQEIEDKSKCIKDYKINQVQEKMHEILVAEFADYITQGLTDFLEYSCKL